MPEAPDPHLKIRTVPQQTAPTPNAPDPRPKIRTVPRQTAPTPDATDPHPKNRTVPRLMATTPEAPDHHTKNRTVLRQTASMPEALDHPCHRGTSQYQPEDVGRWPDPGHGTMQRSESRTWRNHTLQLIPNWGKLTQRTVRIESGPVPSRIMGQPEEDESGPTPVQSRSKSDLGLIWHRTGTGPDGSGSTQNWSQPLLRSDVETRPRSQLVRLAQQLHELNSGTTGASLLCQSWTTRP